MKATFSAAWRVAILFLLLGQAFAASVAPPPDLDAVVERARKEFNVPGMAIAIVQDGQTVVAKGYGVRTMNEPAPVDAETVFNIASNSKGFTAVALAMLVEEGKLRWDDPVIKHLPGFQMYDPWVTREITVRDILSHRSGLGLGAGDLLRFPDTFTREEIVFRQRFIKPASSFRSTYAYNNCLYIVAGEVLKTIAGTTWDDFVRDRIFAPLAMTQSNTSMEYLAAVTNKATPHFVADGRLQTARYENGRNDAPAGGINSSAADMAKWAKALLEAFGTENETGRKVLPSRAGLHELWSAQTPKPTPAGIPPPKLALFKSSFSAYGLGFELRDMADRWIVSHGGSKLGQESEMILVPDLKLGIVILSNGDSREAVDAVQLHLLTHYFGTPENNWIEWFQLKAKIAAANEAKELADRAAQRTKHSRPSLPPANYAGEYVDDWYGNVSIELEAGKLILRFSRTPQLIGDLEHWQFDTFVARWRDRTLKADAFVYFALKPDGAIERMKMAKFSSSTDFSYDFEDLDFRPVPVPKTP